MDAYQHYGYKKSETCTPLTAGQGTVRGDTPLVVSCRKSDFGGWTEDSAAATLKRNGGDYGGGSESLIVR